MNLPNVVIAGAPKCGTSSLFDWLVAHPQICGSSVKEPFFFMDESNPLINPQRNVHKDGLKAYHFFFNHCKEGGITLEGTTHYIFQDTAIRYFSKLQECPLVVFVLRKPWQRVYSSFKFTVNNLGRLDKSVSFSQYVKATLENRENEIIPFFYSEKSKYVLLNDIEYSKYIRYLKKWEAAIGKERMHIILFEEMIKHPHQILSEFCKKLDIDASFYKDFIFEKRNKTYKIKGQRLHRWVRRINKWADGIPLKHYLKKGYYSIQKKKQKKPTEGDQQALEILNAYYKEPNNELAEKFNLDLNLWDQ